MLGLGRYDDLCTKAREEAKAIGAVLMIICGEKGSSFSCQAPREITEDLPNMLRHMADQIEKSVT